MGKQGKPGVSLESIDGREVVVRVHDAFVAGDCFDVSFDREGRSCIGNGHGVQALDESGEPIACDLTPEQHSCLGSVAANKAFDAIEAWNWEYEMDAAS